MLTIPPPDATAPEPDAELPLTSEWLIFIEPWLTIPPPLVNDAVLPSTSLRLSVALQPLAIPPAAMGGPLMEPGWGAGAVAVLPLTSLWLMTKVASHGAPPPLPFPLEIPAPLSEVFPLTWLSLMV